MSVTGAERGAVYHGHASAHAAPGALSTILGWITTVDHKRIGILYGVTAFAFFLIGGIEALIIRLQLARPRQHGRERRDLQRALHHARHHDGVPGDHAVQRGVLQLHDPADDRRARRGLPAAQRAVATGSSCSAACSSTPASWSARRPTAAGSATRASRSRQFSPGPQHRLLAARPADTGRLVGAGRRQLHRHHPQHARARHDADAHAGVRVDDAHRAVPHRAGVPADHGRPHLPDVRPVLRHALLRRGGRRRPASLAAPVLDLRPSGGLHPDPAGLRHRLRGAADLRAQAALRRPGRSSTPASSSASSASACGAITCSPRAWARWPTPPSRSPPCSSRFPPA